MRFSHAIQGRWPFSGDLLQNGHFPCIAWEKSHIARGRKSGLTNWCALGPQVCWCATEHVSAKISRDEQIPVGIFARDCPQSEHLVTNVFAYRELRMCSSFGDKLKAYFGWGKCQEKVAAENPPHFSLLKISDGETTIKIKYTGLRGGGLGGRAGNSPKRCFFSWGNVMTIKI